jgi:hypothetical protein
MRRVSTTALFDITIQLTSVTETLAPSLVLDFTLCACRTHRSEFDSQIMLQLFPLVEL